MRFIHFEASDRRRALTEDESLDSRWSVSVIETQFHKTPCWQPEYFLSWRRQKYYINTSCLFASTFYLYCLISSSRQILMGPTDFLFHSRFTDTFTLKYLCLFVFIEYIRAVLYTRMARHDINSLRTDASHIASADARRMLLVFEERSHTEGP